MQSEKWWKMHTPMDFILFVCGFDSNRRMMLCSWFLLCQKWDWSFLEFEMFIFIFNFIFIFVLLLISFSTLEHNERVYFRKIKIPGLSQCFAFWTILWTGKKFFSVTIDSNDSAHSDSVAHKDMVKCEWFIHDCFIR